ncbi:hypothetical protein ACET3Z_002858 [Daucus carota]
MCQRNEFQEPAQGNQRKRLIESNYVRFDHIQFVQIWTPTPCGPGGYMRCVNPLPPYYANNFSMHGLWPAAADGTTLQSNRRRHIPAEVFERIESKMNRWWANINSRHASRSFWEHEWFQLYIYNRLKKKNLHSVAEIFAQEANLKQSQMVSCNDNLLEEWWETFWPTYCSVAEPNGQSSGQSSMVNAPGQLASQVPMLGAEWFHPSQPLFHADHMHYTMPPSNTLSHLQMAYTVQPPPQVAMVNPTYPGGQELTDTPAAPSPGEANWKDKRPLTGGQMAVPGPDLAPYESGVSASSVPLTHQAAQMHRAGSHPPADQSSKEVQQEASGSLPKKKRGRPPKPSKGKGTAK